MYTFALRMATLPRMICSSFAPIIPCHDALCLNAIFLCVSSVCKMLMDQLQFRVQLVIDNHKVENHS